MNPENAESQEVTITFEELRKLIETVRTAALETNNPAPSKANSKRAIPIEGVWPTCRKSHISINEANKIYKDVGDFTKAALRRSLDTGEIGPLGAVWNTIKETKPTQLKHSRKPAKRLSARLDRLNLCLDRNVLIPILLRKDDRTNSQIARDLTSLGYTRSDGNNFTADSISSTFRNYTTLAYAPIVNPLLKELGKEPLPLRSQVQDEKDRGSESTA